MPEYIEREALLKKANELAGGVFGTPRIIVAIKNAPKADVVGVVRCKECEHYKTQNQSAHWTSTKRYCMRKAAVKVNEDDFCSFGERKEGAEE